MEGSDDHYLYVGPGWTSWSVWSSLKKEKVYIDSGSAGQPCPAHPRNALNLIKKKEGWMFNKADDNSVKNRVWGKDGVLLHCSVHTK